MKRKACKRWTRKGGERMKKFRFRIWTKRKQIVSSLKHCRPSFTTNVLLLALFHFFSLHHHHFHTSRLLYIPMLHLLTSPLFLSHFLGRRIRYTDFLRLLLSPSLSSYGSFPSFLSSSKKKKGRTISIPFYSYSKASKTCEREKEESLIVYLPLPPQCGKRFRRENFVTCPILSQRVSLFLPSFLLTSSFLRRSLIHPVPFNLFSSFTNLFYFLISDHSVSGSLSHWPLFKSHKRHLSSEFIFNKVHNHKRYEENCDK